MIGSCFSALTGCFAVSQSTSLGQDDDEDKSFNPVRESHLHELMATGTARRKSTLSPQTIFSMSKSIRTFSRRSKSPSLLRGSLVHRFNFDDTRNLPAGMNSTMRGPLVKANVCFVVCAQLNRVCLDRDQAMHWAHEQIRRLHRMRPR